MKVLLLGEFSGVYKNLMAGLKELSVDVTWASNGDSWKKIGGANFNLYNTESHSYYEKVRSCFINPLFDQRLRGYDIVQAITPMIFPWEINELVMNRIIRNNGKVFINAAGVDCLQYEADLNGKYRYSLFDDNPHLKNIYSGNNFRSKVLNHAIKNIYSHATGIIPCIPFEYEVPYESFSNLRRCIMFPINYNDIDYYPNVIRDRIVIFHGVTRSLDKGSPQIIEAMEYIQQKYPHHVECIIAEKMPYTKYLKELIRSNVVIDQCKSYGYGMNGCIALAMGKIVLSGSEREMLEAGQISDCPVINITPNAEQIISVLESIIMHSYDTEEMGKKGRDYIMKYHDYKKIAAQYLEEWNK